MRAVSLTGLALIILTAAGCSGDTRAGTALEYSAPTSIGAEPIKPGFEIGLLYYDIDNTSTSTIVIDRVGIAGAGIGRVVRVADMKMALFVPGGTTTSPTRCRLLCTRLIRPCFSRAMAAVARRFSRCAGSG
jgi:hypothetical protein